MKQVISDRIRCARTLRGLSMEELARKMNGRITKQSISKYEKGKMNPRADIVISLSNVLSVPPEYFYENSIKVNDINFRTDRHISEYQTERLRASAQDKIERYLKIENLLALPQEFENPLKKIKVHSRGDIDKAAEKLREVWGLGNFPIFSVYNMLENLGIKLIEYELGVPEVIGFSTMADEHIPLIIINLTANTTVERKRFTALHEVGHLLLNFPIKCNNEDKERYCNLFAGSLLCPSKIFLKELGNIRSSLSLEELISLKNRYGISVSAIVHRAKDLGIISESYYNHIFNKHIHHNVMEIGWGGYPVPEQTDRFKRLLQRAVAEKILPSDEAEKIADQKLGDSLNSLTIL